MQWRKKRCAAMAAFMAGKCCLKSKQISRNNIDIPPTKQLRQAPNNDILAGFGMDSSFLNLSFTW
jgi:hypothetical protein